MELKIGLRSLFDRFPHLSLAGTPEWYDSIAVHGYKRLPVTLGQQRLAIGSAAVSPE
jgi:cytochrome P450